MNLIGDYFIDPGFIEFIQWDQIDHPEQRDRLVQRPHEIHSHAEKRIFLAESDQDLVDAVCALKRAVFVRVKDLRSIYELKTLPITGFPKEHFAQLRELQMIKPKLLETLIEIRRVLEHHDIDPPSKDRCAELAEFCWYFLRATDSFVSKTFDGMFSSFKFGDSPSVYEIHVAVGPRNSWDVRLHGELPSEMVSGSERSGWGLITDGSLMSNRDAPKREGDEIYRLGTYDSKLLPDDIHVIGRPGRELRDKLIRKYFSLYA